jgi:AcrR family transcriptional regulator
MAPRPYNSKLRRQLQAEMTTRIAVAAAALHAEKGVLGTSYADIAQRAGVSLPTVYNHFPSQEALIGACTGHVAAQAPQLPAVDILAAPDLAAAAARLAEGIERVQVHFSPWLAWGEERQVPALQELLDSERRQLTALIVRLLSVHLGEGDHREIAAVWESLLSFDFRQRLTRDHRLSRNAVRRRIVHLLLAAAGPRPAASHPKRPTRRK